MQTNLLVRLICRILFFIYDLCGEASTKILIQKRCIESFASVNKRKIQKA